MVCYGGSFKCQHQLQSLCLFRSPFYFWNFSLFCFVFGIQAIDSAVRINLEKSLQKFEHFENSLICTHTSARKLAAHTPALRINPKHKHNKLLPNWDRTIILANVDFSVRCFAFSFLLASILLTKQNSRTGNASRFLLSTFMSNNPNARIDWHRKRRQKFENAKCGMNVKKWKKIYISIYVIHHSESRTSRSTQAATVQNHNMWIWIWLTTYVYITSYSSHTMVVLLLLLSPVAAVIALTRNPYSLLYWTT